jgi:YgiT-type zinc finger domain-containing protein
VRVVTAYHPDPKEWEPDLRTKEKQLMRCHTCGGTLAPVTTDLPFKLSQRAIVVIRDLPVLQCEACHEYVLEDPVMAQVDRILGGMAEGAELEVVRFAA